MKPTPFAHGNRYATDVIRMEEAYDVASGQVAEVKDGNYVFLARGRTTTQYDAMGGSQSFSWNILYVSLTDSPPMYLLHWTDDVANDWGEWFDDSYEAFRRLAHLTWITYTEGSVIPLEEWHQLFRKGEM